MHAKEVAHSISFIDEKKVNVKLTFCIAVGIYRMVCKSNFVALACCINHKIYGGEAEKTTKPQMMDGSATNTFLSVILIVCLDLSSWRR